MRLDCEERYTNLMKMYEALKGLHITQVEKLKERIDNLKNDPRLKYPSSDDCEALLRQLLENAHDLYQTPACVHESIRDEPVWQDIDQRVTAYISQCVQAHGDGNAAVRQTPYIPTFDASNRRNKPPSSVDHDGEYNKRMAFLETENDRLRSLLQQHNRSPKEHGPSTPEQPKVILPTGTSVQLDAMTSSHDATTTPDDHQNLDTFEEECRRLRNENRRLTEQLNRLSMACLKPGEMADPRQSLSAKGSTNRPSDHAIIDHWTRHIMQLDESNAIKNINDVHRFIHDERASPPTILRARLDKILQMCIKQTIAEWKRRDDEIMRRLLNNVFRHGRR